LESIMSITPPGRHREDMLVEQLRETRALTNALGRELPNVNDEWLRPKLVSILETATALFDVHGSAPQPNVADDLVALLSAVRTLRIPYRDPDLGETPTIERLRKAKGLMVASLIDTLESAEANGLYPRKPPVPHAASSDVPRSDVEGLLKRISHRLADVQASLDALDQVGDIPTDFQQQTALINFYVGSMRVEIDLAKLQISVGETTIDFSALSRIVETMADLTGEFMATVLAWRGLISDGVVGVARDVRKQVSRVTVGVRTAVRWVVRARSKNHQLPSSPDETFKPQPIGIGYRLPKASIQQLIGLLSTILELPYSGRAALPYVAEHAHIDDEQLFVLIEALQLLSFARVEGGDIWTTPIGRAFAEADLQERKRIFSEQLLRTVPLAAHIRKVLDERPWHSAPEGRFLAELEDYLSEEEAREVFDTVINWGRYAELFAYDYDRGVLSLENPS
jgi:hypothetical protein